MNRRNIANYTTFNTLLVNNLEIQSSGVGLSIFDSDPNNPTFSFNPTTQEFNMVGNLNVTGDASFETIIVQEFEGGMQFLASTNPGDTWDLGINAAYQSGGTKYTGLIRDASDTAKRWTFFKDISTLPTLEVAGIDSTKLDSVRMNYLYVNDGSASTPSITFHNDIDTNTGFYLAAQNEIGITAGGLKIAGVRYVSGSDTEIQLDTTTSLKLLRLKTIDDITSDNPAVTTGHIYMRSESAKDKWFKFYSGTGEATPSYAGAVFTSPSTNYFITNTGSSMEILRNTDTSTTNPPDYRDATTAQLMIFTGTTSTETKNPFIIPLGSLGNLSLKFSGELTTGIYRSGTNSIGLVCAGSNILNIAPAAITAYQPLNLSDGSVSAPALGFTGETGNLTGLYRPAENQIGFSTGGLAAMVLSYSSPAPQIITLVGGTSSTPTYSFAGSNTGSYSPTNEAAEGHIAFSLGGLETLRLRRRTGTTAQGLGNIEFYNSTVFTPDATNKRVAIYDADTRINNTFKAYNGSFQSYNLIDESLLLLYTFRAAGALGLDYSNNGINATLVGSPVLKTTERDSNLVVKRDVLDLTGNTSGTSYLNLTSQLASFTSIDQATISFWFKITGTLTESNTIFGCYKTTGAKKISIEVLADAATYSNALQVTVESDALTTLQFHTATSADSGTPSPVSVKDNLWHHVVIHFGSSGGSVAKIIMYYDGVELTQAANKIYYTSNGDNNLQPSLSTNSFNDLTFNYVSIGALFTGAGTLKYTGYLKDFYITRRLLSASEVAILSTEPTLYTYTIDAAQVKASDFSVVNQGLFANGTETAPSITFTSDTNLGLYRSAADVLGIATSGAERMTISDTILQYNTNDFEINSTNRWLKLTMSSTNTGPRIVFQHTGTPMRHSIRTSHDSSFILNNYMDFYLADTGALDADGLGNNQVMRLSVSAATANSAIQNIYGVTRVGNGTTSEPSYSFINDTTIGLYNAGGGLMGFVANSAQKMSVGSSGLTIGSSSADITSRLYLPNGSTFSPSLTFTAYTTTGLTITGANQIGIICSSSTISNFTSTGITNSVSVINESNSTSAFIVRQNSIPGNTILNIDTTNLRIGFGYTALYLGKIDGIFDTSQRLKLGASSDVTGIVGLSILNENTSTTNSAISTLSLGRTSATRNEATMGFHYVSSGSTSNKLQFGFTSVSNDQFNITADGSTNVTGTFTVSSTSTLSGQLRLLQGSAAAPSYSFISNTTDGIYQPASNQIGFSTNSTLRALIQNTFTEFYTQLRIADGSAAAPSLTFTSDTSQNTGLYYIGDNSFGVAASGLKNFVFNHYGTAPHESWNAMDFYANGTNLRARIQNEKIRLTANQSMLNINPIVHFKFLKNISNLTEQDESINKTAILSSAATYTTSTISLTDANGVGLLDYTAIEITADSNRIETAALTGFSTMSEFNIFIKFKLTSSSTTGTLFRIFGNSPSTANVITLQLNASNSLTFSITANSATFLQATTAASSITTNVWYSVLIRFRSTGNSLTLNGTAATLTYSTGSSSTAFTPATFSSTANPVAILGRETSGSALGYYAEFYMAPVTITETPSIIYRTQAHEVYTNKLQLGGLTELITEGSILRADAGNNLIWDNSLQVAAGWIQLNNSKVMRAPDGSASAPAYSYISDTNSGVYSVGADNIGITTGGVLRLNITTTQINAASSVNMLINNTTLPTSGATGALIVTGGIGLGNGTATASRVNFGAAYTPGESSHKMISLYDTQNNNYQFYGLGITTNTLRYTTDATTADHVFYAATSASAANELFRIKGTGVVQTQDGAVSTPAYSYANSTTSGMYLIGSNNIGLSTNGNKRIDVSDATTQITNDFQTSGGFRYGFTVHTGTTLTLNTTHCIVEFSYATNSSNVTVTLPEALTLNAGRIYTLIKTGNGGGNLVINTFDTNDFIDDNSTTQITLSTVFDRVTLVCNGVNRWYTI